ncbi:MAG: hypothetical protein QOH96_2095, partial [Blastocatellia bacterium]|nr:hypothetical protein [Blastocatellia bacterium]
MYPARHCKPVRNTIGFVVIFLSTLTAFGQASRSKTDRPPAPKRSHQKRKAARETNPGEVNSSERVANGQDPQAQQSQATAQQSPTIMESEHNDVSPPLRSIPPAARTKGHHVHDIEILPRNFNRGATDPVIQRSAATALAPVTNTNFDGIGQGFTGPAGTFSVSSAPPDTNGDVGPNHYVQVVNSDLAIFNKSGTAIYGPVPTNTLWSGFGGLCQTDNDGDGVVVYDAIANRWVVSQFAVSGTTTGYLQCVAVSTGPDPTGTWNRYSFSYGSSFPDYPKMGVWPDAYYETFNMFNSAGTSFLGARACAYDRAKMIAGQPATQVCFNPTDAGSVVGGLLPADLDGTIQPPPGAPNYVIALGNNANQLAVYKFHVDFITPANSTLTGPTDITTASFSEACAGGTCIPQTGTTQKLDSLADRLMFRLAYRNFNDHEALVVNHSVTAGTGTGLRWYELRPDASRNLSIFQQGTYAPDSNFRWMGSIAMDKNGNMGLGFSVSGSALHPGIHYTGRLASSPTGVMDQGEGTAIDGAGSQTGSSLSRWGDYSAMTVDPSDECTFWYTTEYIPANGAFNWRTRIASFKFPGCGSTNDFSMSANPTSISVAPGGSGTSTISTTLTTGSAQTITLSASGLPAGATASFSPASVTSGSSSTLTLTAGASTPAGTYSITVTGTGASATHTTSVSFTVVSAVNDFSISASPNTLSIAQ